MINATVRCSDGKCYPCQFIDWINDFNNLLPTAYIRFTDKHPEYSSNVMVVNMLHINFGGNYGKVQNRQEANPSMG